VIAEDAGDGAAARCAIRVYRFGGAAGTGVAGGVDDGDGGAGGIYYRRLEILNSAAVAALVLLVVKPEEVFDTSSQLSFLAIGYIGGVAVPWIERHVQPFIGALHGSRDVPLDGAFSARQAQFRLDLRAVAAVMTSRLSA